MRSDGPPLVRMSISPNAWNAKMVPTIAAKNTVGDSIGSDDVAEARPRALAVDPGRFEQLVGHALQARRHEDEREAEALPDGGGRHGDERPLRVLERMSPLDPNQ